MSLLDTKTGFTTPWHCSIALMANGDWVSSPMGEFQKDPRMEVVYEDGRPSYFRETTVDLVRETTVDLVSEQVSVNQPVKILGEQRQEFSNRQLPSAVDKNGAEIITGTNKIGSIEETLAAVEAVHSV